MAAPSALINFRVTPKERQQLRVALLEESETLQSFFGRIVQEKLSALQKERGVTEQEHQYEDHTAYTV